MTTATDTRDVAPQCGGKSVPANGGAGATLPRLTDVGFIKEILTRHRFVISKGLGQNFLCDASVLESIVKSADPADEDLLEIGPGIGVLTGALAFKARSVTAVEAATRLKPILEETLADHGNISIRYADFLHVPAEQLPRHEFVVAANLPYSITTPVLFRFLDGDFSWKRMVFTIQAEVAERLAAKPCTKAYGALTVSAQASASVEIVRRIPSSCFWPRPRVESAIVRLLPHPGRKPSNLRGVLRTAFSSRRKTLRNALAAIPGGSDAIREAGINDTRRPETLSVEEWIDLARRLGR